MSFCQGKVNKTDCIVNMQWMYHELQLIFSGELLSLTWLTKKMSERWSVSNSFVCNWIPIEVGALHTPGIIRKLLDMNIYTYLYTVVACWLLTRLWNDSLGQIIEAMGNLYSEIFNYLENVLLLITFTGKFCSFGFLSGSLNLTRPYILVHFWMTLSSIGCA